MAYLDPTTESARRAAALALRGRIAAHGDAAVVPFEVWLYGMAFLPVRGRTRPSGPRRRKKVARVIASTVRVESGHRVEPRDFKRLEAALRWGLERRVGERLNSTAGRAYKALLQLGCEAPGFGVCRLCQVVFERRRADAAFCSDRCRKARVPVLRESKSWVSIPGPRFAASADDMRRRLVEARCAECGAAFWAPTNRHRYCERHAGVSARAARSRRLASP